MRYSVCPCRETKVTTLGLCLLCTSRPTLCEIRGKQTVGTHSVLCWCMHYINILYTSGSKRVYCKSLCCAPVFITRVCCKQIVQQLVAASLHGHFQHFLSKNTTEYSTKGVEAGSKNLKKNVLETSKVADNFALSFFNYSQQQ